MLAARYARYGPPEVIGIVELPEPEPGPGEVLVALAAAGLNPADYKVRRGAAPVRPLPSGIGREFAGTVLALGPGAEGFSPGDEVIGTGEGVIGERIAAPVALLARKPAGLDWRVAASIPVAVQTAACAVASQSPGPDDTVLVSAAAGGVGYPAAQLARRTGARVLGTASRGNHERLRAIGVEPLEYGPGLAERLRALAPEGITIVLDHHGVETIEAALELGVARERINTTAGYAERYAVRGVGRVGLDRELVEELSHQLLEGELEIRLDRSFGLADLVEAYRRLEEGRPAGKVVIVF